MRRILAWINAILLSGGILGARDIAGNWQEALVCVRLLPFTSLKTTPQRPTAGTVWRRDSLARFKSTFITVDKNVKLEVIDWGGAGRPLILLAGLGDYAHVFDQFAPKLTANYRVYGLTRRGFDASSAPAPANGNYSADQLGDDVLAVADSLKLIRPVLVGHSIAGEELSSIGSRHPDKVAGLVYLDAGYSYAYYDQTHGDLLLDSLELEKKLGQLIPGTEPQDQRHLVEELLQTRLPQLEKDLREQQRALQVMPPQQQRGGGFSIAAHAVLSGQQKYTAIPVPILAIFASPHDLGQLLKDDPNARAAMQASDAVRSEGQARAFEIGLPSARVVRLPNANHYVFRSNEVDVLREMNAFLKNLP